jgi:holo-ACP synthase CitX
MRSGASRPEAALLAARDARQALLDRHRPPPGQSLLAVSLNVPGPDKEPPGALPLLAWALARACLALPGVRPLHSRGDAAGPFALLAVGAGPEVAKRACLAIEVALPAARLVDLDVYGPDGRQLDRAALGLPPRPCLLCAEAARDCIRAGRHAPGAVLERARALLADPGL